MISKVIAEDLIYKVQKSIDKAEKIVIVVHVGPDGDAMGASLALWHYLMTIRKRTCCDRSNGFPEFSLVDARCGVCVGLRRKQRYKRQNYFGS